MVTDFSYVSLTPFFMQLCACSSEEVIQLMQPRPAFQNLAFLFWEICIIKLCHTAEGPLTFYAFKMLRLQNIHSLSDKVVTSTTRCPHCSFMEMFHNHTKTMQGQSLFRFLDFCMCYLKILFLEITMNADFYFKDLVKTWCFSVIQLMKCHIWLMKNCHSQRKIIFYLNVLVSQLNSSTQKSGFLYWWLN